MGMHCPPSSGLRPPSVRASNNTVHSFIRFFQCTHSHSAPPRTSHSRILNSSPWYTATTTKPILHSHIHSHSPPPCTSHSRSRNFSLFFQYEISVHVKVMIIAEFFIHISSQSTVVISRSSSSTKSVHVKVMIITVYYIHSHFVLNH
jgi:hypothetical protein